MATEASPESMEHQRLVRLLDACDSVIQDAQVEERLLEEVCAVLVREGQYAAAWVGIAENDIEKSVRPIAQSGYERGYLDEIKVSWDEARDVGKGPAGTAIRTGLTQVIRKLVTNPAMLPWWDAAIRRGYLSIISVPITVSADSRYVLTIYASEFDAFSGPHVELYGKLCADISAALKKIRAR